MKGCEEYEYRVRAIAEKSESGPLEDSYRRSERRTVADGLLEDAEMPTGGVRRHPPSKSKRRGDYKRCHHTSDRTAISAQEDRDSRVGNVTVEIRRRPI